MLEIINKGRLISNKTIEATSIINSSIWNNREKLRETDSMFKGLFNKTKEMSI